MTLIEFLLARIAEDEESVRSLPTVGKDASVETRSREVDAYLRRLRPARVLAECEAKRRIAGMHYREEDQWDPTCDGSIELKRPGFEVLAWWPCETLRLLAAVYSDHPDYRDEWRA